MHGERMAYVDGGRLLLALLFRSAYTPRTKHIFISYQNHPHYTGVYVHSSVTYQNANSHAKKMMVSFEIESNDKFCF
jgi:hypothetical protein